MLEKFSPEEIRQLKKELRERECTDVQKRTIWEEVKETRMADPRDFWRLPHHNEFEKAAYLFADVVTDNFVTLSRKYLGTDKEYEKANSVIPFDKSEEWTEAISVLFDMYLKKYKE